MQDAHGATFMRAIVLLRPHFYNCFPAMFLTRAPQVREEHGHVTAIVHLCTRISAAHGAKRLA